MNEFIVRSLKAVWKQKYIVVLFIVFGAGSMGWWSLSRPDIYKASQTLKPEPFKIEPSNMQSAENDIALTLYSQDWEKENLSSLKDLIEKNNLFEKERASGESLDSLAKKMITGILVDKVEISKNVVNSFNLSFMSSNRENAEKVTSVLVKQITESRSNDDPQNKIVILSSCCPQAEVVAPKRGLMVAFGSFAGLLIGIVFGLTRRAVIS